MIKLSVLAIYSLLVSLFCYTTATTINKESKLTPLKPSEDYNHYLDAEEDKPGQYMIYWKYDNENIQFELHCKTKGWLGFGLSSMGGMKGADIAIGWVDKNGKGHLQDCHATENTRPKMDEQQDLKLLDAAEVDDYTILKFKRKLATCDKDDREIKSGTYFLIFAWNNEDPVTGNSDWKYHDVNRFARQIILLNYKEQTVEQQQTLPSDTFTVDIRMPNITIAAKDTYYFCELFELPKFNEDVHLIQYEIVFGAQGKKFVHHLLGFDCAEGYAPSQPLRRECGAVPIPQEYSANCMASLSFAWGVGGFKSYSFPPEAGYLIKSNDKPRYILLEMHYDNPKKLSGVVDDTGMRLYFTRTLRKHHLGVMSLGSNLLQIPPQSESIKFSSICYPECTNAFFPDDGITVITGLLHTHLAGIGLKTSLIRDGKEIMNVFDNPTYDFEYQNAVEIKPLKLKKGDALYTECVYRTKDRTKYTSFGFGTYDEMCINYIFYYPKLPDLVNCESFMPTQNLMKFYRSLTKDGLTPGLNVSNDDNTYYQQAEYIDKYFKNEAKFTPQLIKRFEDFFGSKTQNRTIYCGSFASPEKQIYKENQLDYVPSQYYVEPDICKNSTSSKMPSSLFVFFLICLIFKYL